MKYGLFMGQSNALGSGYGGPWDIDSRVRVWNSVSNREDLTMLGSAWVVPDRSGPPLNQNSTMVFNHQGAWCAHYLARALNEDQRLIVSARNGAGIGNWHTGTAKGAFYDRMMAILNAAGVTSVDWFGWNQGSADNLNYTSYRSKWDGLVNAMMADGIITSATPIFVTETAFATTPTINGILKQIADDSPRVGLVEAGYFETDADNVHFTGRSLARMGYESVRAMAGTETWLKDIVNPLAKSDVIGTGFSRKA